MYLPTWLYERLPLIYTLLALAALVWLPITPLVVFSATLLLSASALIWRWRRKAARSRVRVNPMF